MKRLPDLSRRRFVQTTAISVVSLPLTSLATSILVPKKKDKLGIALVGLGYYSRDLLAPALQMTTNCYLAGIVTGSPTKIPYWQERYGIPDKNIYDYENMHTVANNPDIDIVYVVLPNIMHEKYSVIAANAGKHVWCEKPMAMNVRECESMIDACRKNRAKLSIGYRLQHEPNTQSVMSIARDKSYGKIKNLIAEAGFYDRRTAYHWRLNKSMGGGAMYDMGVYPLNAARYASAQEPVAVSAHSERHRPELYNEVDETMHFELEFPGGFHASCKTSFGQNMNKLRVDCEKGWYQLIPFQSYGGVQGATSDGKKLNKPIANQQAKQMDDDALAIINDTPVRAPGEEGLKDIQVVEAIYKSASEKKRVVI